MATENIPKRDVDLACGDYVLRTLVPDDASDRWADWMSEPKNQRLVNAGPTAMTRADVRAYIERFDQTSHLLIGIFVKATGQHIGFFRLDIDHKLRRCLMFLMIGEQKYRHWSVTHDIRVPFQDYIFDELKLNAILATVLDSNQAMVRYMQKSGWVIDKTAATPVRSETGDATRDLCFMRLSREAWQIWKQKNLPRS